MHRYFTANNSYRCIPVLQDLVALYRNTPHTSLKGMIPRYVSNTNANEVILYLATRKLKTNRNMPLQRKQKRIKSQYNKVRIPHLKRNVENKYQEK